MNVRTATSPKNERQSSPAGAAGATHAPAPSVVQTKAALRGMDYATQLKALSPTGHDVQREAAENVHAAAAQGTAGSGGSLPHAGVIQQAFGRHDVSAVQAHVGGAAKSASQAMGAEAYASGNHVAFADAPSLHTAAHEAAHVVQQRAGVSLADGVGQTGDAYERHADQVADAVVAGRSAEGLLGVGSGGGAGGEAVQRKEDDESQGVPLAKLNVAQANRGAGDASPYSPNDVVQGYPDCHLLASIAAIAQTHPEEFDKIITREGKNFRVKLGGKSVLVDKLMLGAKAGSQDIKRFKQMLEQEKDPAKRQRLVGVIARYEREASSALPDGAGAHWTDVVNGKPEVWVAIIEEAFIRKEGVGVAQGGDPKHTLDQLRGAEYAEQVFWARQDPATALRAIQEAVVLKYPAVISTTKAPPDKGVYPKGWPYQVAVGHAVAVKGIRGGKIQVWCSNSGDLEIGMAALSDGFVERVTCSRPKENTTLGTAGAGQRSQKKA